MRQRKTTYLPDGRQFYLDNNDLMQEWDKWKQTGVMSERMGKQMLTLANHVMTGRSFAGYPEDMKQDMVQDGVVKIMKNLKNFKPDKGSIFSYWTRCVYTAAYVYLSAHYKRVNEGRQMLLDALETAMTNMPPSPMRTETIKALEQQIEEYGPSDYKQTKKKENKTL